MQPLYTRRFLSLLAVVSILCLASAFAAPELAYLGSWSNGRGETLVLTAKTIRFANDKPVHYRDLTKATDGKVFTLEITEPGEVNFFAEKFLSVTCGDDEMHVIGFKSQADLLHDRNPGSSGTWYKDDDAKSDD